MSKRLLTCVIFLLLFIEFFHPVYAITQDLGRHILTGQIILQNFIVPKVNLLTYTFPEFPFVNHHWGSEVIFRIIYQIGGFNPLLILTTATILAAFLILFRYTLKHASIYSIALTSLLYFAILFERTDVRPEMFSFLFLSSFIVILFKNREKETKLLYLLPLLELLWTNMHIYFVIGIVITGLFFIDACITYRSRPDKIGLGKVKQLGVITLLICISSIFNPHGIAGAVYPFRVMQNYGYPIQENQNLFFLQQLGTNPTIIFQEVAIVLLFILLFLSRRKTRPIDWLLTLVFSFLSWMAIRNVPLFIFATFPAFAVYLTPQVQRLIHLVQKKINIQKHILIGAILFGICVIAVMESTWFISKKGFGFGEPTGAKYAADFYIKNHIKGPTFNNFDIGSYFEYRLYPTQKAFVDGRPEAFPAKFFAEAYIPMQQNPKAFEDVDNLFQFNSIFFAHTDQTPWAEQFIYAIVHNEQWKIVYLDDTIIILARNNKANKKLVDNNSIDETTVDFDPPEENTKLFSYAHFFATAGWKKQAQKSYEAILQKDPNNCPVLYNMTALLSEKSSPLTSVYQTRYTNHCR